MFNIKEIRLLTADELRKYRNIIPELDDDWWLSSFAKERHVFCVDEDNRLQVKEHFLYCEIRPVLVISDFPSDKKVGEEIRLFNYGEGTWTVLKTPSKEDPDTIVLYNGSLGNIEFDDKTTEWEMSTIKTKLNEWAFKDREIFNTYVYAEFSS